MIIIVFEKTKKINYIYKLEHKQIKEFNTKPNCDYFIILKGIGEYDEIEYDILYFHTTKNNKKNINLKKLKKIILDFEKEINAQNININKNFMNIIKIHKNKFKKFYENYNNSNKKYNKIEKIDFIKSVRYYLIYIIGLKILNIVNDKTIKNEIKKIFNFNPDFIVKFLNSKNDNSNNNLDSNPNSNF